MAILSVPGKLALMGAVLAAGLMAGAGSARADSIAVWNFNDADLFSVDHGAATSTLTTTAPTAVSQGSSGSPLNEVPGDTAGKDLIFTAGASEVNNGQSLLFTVDLTGFTGVTLKYATDGTGTGFMSQSWAYSTNNGTSFTSTTTITPTTGYAIATVDLSGLGSFSGVAEFRVTLTGATGAQGTNHFDNVVFAGTPVAAPLPSAAGMGVVGLLGAAVLTMKRRRAACAVSLR